MLATTQVETGATARTVRNVLLSGEREAHSSDAPLCIRADSIRRPASRWGDRRVLALVRPLGRAA
jgi:hypothetical protein